MKSKNLIEKLLKEWEDEQTDELLEFFIDTIYTNEKPRRNYDRNAAEAIAKQKAPLYAAQVRRLLGDNFDFSVISGGYADGGGFSIDLEDGHAIEGNANGAKFSQ